MARSLSMRCASIPMSPRNPEAAATKSDPNVGLPATPPYTYQSTEADARQSLQTALQAMRTERDALDHLQNLYATSEVAQRGLCDAVDAILDSQNRMGKLIISGVGKSSIVARKAVATLTSLHIQCRFLDPLAALHGDLGMITENDTLMLISYSGRTRELVEIISTIAIHLNMGYLPLIAVTGQVDATQCALFDNYPPQSCILLPAPIVLSEKETFGIPAPTTSTTVAFATLDALALVLAEKHHPEPAEIFHRYHPGGTIGLHASLKPGSDR